ncbi:LysR family transcriptional regulator [Vibrio sagamiensis]|uniref:LysR family transcriptional regulator n=1 Tax=Vibrio sagamiensis NBRC 104589 TaxID=1219064 RepID=A0A511QDJ0_9VIBR|nr:LysR family transcriptional regulator [Vibrio sagamiensis]PNQ65373.1 LysR family transcriptional regulator [Vibrio agarivorans]GEM75371.1 LysR family transcriptional regulator [Vibrio sagamiensis NBRC 104589]
MESKQLRHFLAVAQHGNFTHAAKALYIAQPALSVSIKKFEQSLGVTLFRRNDKAVTLTQEGEVLLVHAQRVIEQLRDAQLAIDELKGLTKGEVRLGTPSMMGSYFFPNIIMAFKSQYPELKLTLVEAGTQSIREMLLNGELDIGVISSTEESDDIESDHLFSSQMVAAVGAGHDLAKQESINFEAFFDHELVLFQHGYFHREFLEQIQQAKGFEMRSAFETNLLPLILSIIKQEFAITALLELVTQNESDIVGIPFEPPVNLDLALAWKKHGYLSIADRTFIDFVKRFV